jgi:hypothetical protein
MYEQLLRGGSIKKKTFDVFLDQPLNEADI